MRAAQRVLQGCISLCSSHSPVPRVQPALQELACAASSMTQGPSQPDSICAAGSSHQQSEQPCMPEPDSPERSHQQRSWRACGSATHHLISRSSSQSQHPCCWGQPQGSLWHLWHSPWMASHPSQHPAQHTQGRGYKSLKKSLKPVYAKASKLAVQPYMDPELQSKPDAKELARQAALKAAPIIDTALPEIPTVPVPPEFQRVGRITGGYTLDLKPQFAVIAIRGTQFKVTTDDIVFVSHIKEAAVNEVLSLDRVLLHGNLSTTSIGRPYLTNACVLAAVEEHFLDGKVHVFHYKKRNRYKKYHEVRQPLTALRILHVVEDVRSQGRQRALASQVPVDWYSDLTRDQKDRGVQAEEAEVEVTAAAAVAVGSS